MPKVTLAYVHDDAGRVTSFEESLLALVAYDNDHQRYLAHDAGRMPIRFGTDGLPAARNRVAAQFLLSDSDYLLWVDTDMGFAPETLAQMMLVADPQERPIIGALCFTDRQMTHDGMSGYRTKPYPTLYHWVEADDGVARFTNVPMYPVNMLISVGATGSACILIHRSALEKILETFGPEWYSRTPGTDGQLLGEDISFCVRALYCQVPIHVHTGVRTTHYKARWLGETDHWRLFNPPPATDEVAVIVPVLKRPQNAEPFMRSLRASTGLATAYAIVEPGDEDSEIAWKDAGAQVVPCPGMRTFAQKVNFGYRWNERYGRQPWLFITGDDVRFHPGWLDHAQHVADVLRADVVGTNDLGNPRVMSGEHSCHLLIRRSYVDDVGASWDGPKVVASEAYHHWYVDDEIVTAAKQRGVWQMALGAVVEHNHPFWGKAEDDEVYRLGQSYAEDDRATWAARLAANS